MEPSDGSESSRTSSAQTEINFRLLVWDIAWFGLAIPATSRFLSVYAIRLDASASLLGWMAALPSIIALATSAAAGWWRARHPNVIRAMRWPSFLYRLVFLLPALTPFFPARWQPLWLVATVALPALPQGIASVLFLVLLREGVGSQKIPALMSRRSLVFNVTVAIGTLAFGFWLERAPFPVNYQVMFALSFVFGVLSYASTQRMTPLPSEPVPLVPDHAPMRPWQSPGFKRVAFVAVVMHISFFTILPIIPLRLVEDLGADEAYMSIFALAELAAAAFAASQTTRLVHRYGSLNVIAAGLVVTGAAGLIFALGQSLTLMLVGAALSGGAWTAAGITLFTFFAENTPSESLTPFSTVYNQIVMLAVFIGPLLGSQLAGTSLSLTTVMVFGTVLRFIAAILVCWDGPYHIGQFRRRVAPRAGM